ncbi:hypothetical protein Xen7305DRAFT_00027510 [Xenococcus sp. PCC 7305]|uniref:hypothetical protein n=1 Tax=Xenococcus sp. PCC 7305 TaxID=102125 RepID=UPI0002ABB887|nr:hypothetical protein [Xenococcus sp. PCC 7305]ELS03033.1 hypothetical protein Xen7305DRAFT_00027510 [Xenococcus sp. PCC 7305]
MSPRKLTEEDKQNILELYRSSEATTSTLATSFGVSSSTISRFLKNSLVKSEYDDLIQQKRLARTAKGEAKVAAAVNKSEKKPPKSKAQEIILPPQQLEIATEPEEPPEEKSLPNQLIISHTPLKLENKEVPTEAVTSKPTPSLVVKNAPISKKPIIVEEEILDDDDDDDVDVAVLSEMLGEDLDDIDDDDDDEDDDWDLEEDEAASFPHSGAGKVSLQIRPLAEASLPRVCYLVIDRAAELIVKPLQDFADLGSIPQNEIEQKTLPVFDNHRVAKRFSHRREKVIKVPDSEIIKKTAHYLYSKGITRLLIEGQIYSVSLD